jgi:uncharacterized UBP type Zn finger protein
VRKFGVTNNSSRLTEEDGYKFRGETPEKAIFAPIDKDALDSLLNMGFEEKEAREALTRYKNNVEDSVEYLTGGNPALPASPSKASSKIKGSSSDHRSYNL